MFKTRRCPLFRGFTVLLTPLTWTQSTPQKSHCQYTYRTSLLNHVPHAPSHLNCLHVLVSYVFSHLCALRVFVPLCLTCLKCLRTLHALPTRFIYAPCTSFSPTLYALFVRHKIFLGCFCSLAETFYFPRTIKDTTNGAIFM